MRPLDDERRRILVDQMKSKAHLFHNGYREDQIWTALTKAYEEKKEDQIKYLKDLIIIDNKHQLGNPTDSAYQARKNIEKTLKAYYKQHQDHYRIVFIDKVHVDLVETTPGSVKDGHRICLPVLKIRV